MAPNKEGSFHLPPEHPSMQILPEEKPGFTSCFVTGTEDWKQYPECRKLFANPKHWIIDLGVPALDPMEGEGFFS